jgi:hypothetical protein
MAEQEVCVFKKHLAHPSETLTDAKNTDIEQSAEYCDVSDGDIACKGILDVANARLHGECLRPDQVKQVVGDEAAMTLLGEYTPEPPNSEPILPTGRVPQELFTGGKDGKIIIQPSPLYDDNLGHIGMGAVVKRHRGFRA